ncbi:hypothetical protein [uncultured Tyzzerella sp.]|uniref:hypothetical protein n=1 Tax=uncultured Tyzzerella sp. TaxID=2321398 RepID=UPI0029431758|nr:hypothetical protein [uncultured Tyzzerella sp.]
MSNLNQMEINAIRECVSNHITIASKLSCYATKACEPELKEMFKSSSLKAEQSAQKLVQLL